MPTSEPTAFSPDQGAVIRSLMSLRFGSSIKTGDQLQPDISRFGAVMHPAADAAESLDVYREVLGPTYIANVQGKPTA